MSFWPGLLFIVCAWLAGWMGGCLYEARHHREAIEKHNDFLRKCITNLVATPTNEEPSDG